MCRLWCRVLKHLSFLFKNRHNYLLKYVKITNPCCWLKVMFCWIVIFNVLNYSRHHSISPSRRKISALQYFIFLLDSPFSVFQISVVEAVVANSSVFSGDFCPYPALWIPVKKSGVTNPAAVLPCFELRNNF